MTSAVKICVCASTTEQRPGNGEQLTSSFCSLCTLHHEVDEDRKHHDQQQNRGGWQQERWSRARCDDHRLLDADWLDRGNHRADIVRCTTLDSGIDKLLYREIGGVIDHQL